MVRDCTPDDVIWLAQTARAAYAPVIEGYYPEGAAAWISTCVASPEMLVLRDDGVVAFAAVATDPWAPSRPYCDLVHLFGKATRAMEAFDVVAAVNERRKALGARRFYVGSIYADLSPIARRLGGRPLTTMHVIED